MVAEVTVCIVLYVRVQPRDRDQDQGRHRCQSCCKETCFWEDTKPAERNSKLSHVQLRPMLMVWYTPVSYEVRAEDEVRRPLQTPTPCVRDGEVASGTYTFHQYTLQIMR